MPAQIVNLNFNYLDERFAKVLTKKYKEKELEDKMLERLKNVILEFGNGFSFTVLDEEVKDKNDNPSIVLILCQNKKNKIVDYTLKYINKPVGVSEYKIFGKLSNDILKELEKGTTLLNEK